MNDRAGFFAGCADALTSMCVYYLVAGVLIIGREGWGVQLFWLLLCAAACALIYARVLRTPRSTEVLAALTGGLLLACLGLFLLVSRTALSFGYIFMLLIGAGMAAGLPLYHTLRRPTVPKHLAHLDVLIIALTALLLVREALGIGYGTAALMIAVLLMDAAGAVGLRMSDGAQDTQNAFKGTLVALIAAAVLTLVIWLFSALFSRSAGITESLLGGLGAVLSSIGGAMERFFLWLSSLVTPRQDFGTLELEQMPSLAAAEQQLEGGNASADTTAVGIALVVSVLVIAAAAVILLRKRKFQRGTNGLASSSQASERRTGGTASALWRRLTQALRFWWTALVRRDTPGGLLIRLERLGRRRHTPRLPGESMRHFIRRMDGSGGLDALSDALDAEYYGGAKRSMSAGQCRALRKYMRKAVQHG